MCSERRRILFELVFFPPDIADGARPPAFFPMSKVRHGVLGAATEALRFRHGFGVFDFGLGHSNELLY